MYILYELCYLVQSLNMYSICISFKQIYYNVRILQKQYCLKSCVTEVKLVMREYAS